MHLLIFVVSCLLVRWRYYSVSISKQSRVQLCLIFPGRHGKYIFIQERFYLQGIPNNINEQDTSFLDCKHKHMMKSGASPDKVGILHRLLPIGLTSSISKGYHSLVPGLISICSEVVWVPLKFRVVVYISVLDKS